MKDLTKKELELVMSLIEYIEDSESEDFEEQCQENNETPQDLIFNDNSKMSNHIFYKAAQLRYLLNIKV